ncbi:unnamed protein product [Symbiodinium necroappetens]|uniref:Uncharacterized protein n=1 Tax=Symbiodinium necroappetens TaxID=1628268 RepID=A0A812LHY8_9DINO|nr:unnamed protein product [Symbiodinium necroappetens]
MAVAWVTAASPGPWMWCSPRPTCSRSCRMSSGRLSRPASAIPLPQPMTEKSGRCSPSAQAPARLRRSRPCTWPVGAPPATCRVRTSSKGWNSRSATSRPHHRAAHSRRGRATRSTSTWRTALNEGQPPALETCRWLRARRMTRATMTAPWPRSWPMSGNPSAEQDIEDGTSLRFLPAALRWSRPPPQTPSRTDRIG